jgi:lysyl-tRNA synthetase class 1
MQTSETELYSWPFQEAVKILEHWKKYPAPNGICRFEIGYGPSGLPHLGTFCESKRTAYIINAFQKISNVEAELICFSDDLDALRSVPQNLPNQEGLKKYIGYALSSIPDPFGKEKSFADYMNTKMRSFLDRFEINYKFFSAKQCYESGMFDEYLLKVLEKYDEIMEVMLPTLGHKRQETYSPFFPICQTTGKVLQVQVLERCLATGSISYQNPETQKIETTKVTGGKCKLQWKPDFAMRWAALDIKYEIFGKDHLPSAPIYSKICQILGKEPPEQFIFELFLSEDGKKISKSKGNSITLDNLLKYFPQKSIELFLYNNPKKAKKVAFDVFLKSADEYINLLKIYPNLTEVQKCNSPLYHLHNGDVPKENNFGEINFSMLINLINVLGNKDVNAIKAFIQEYDNSLNLQYNLQWDALINNALAYYEDVIEPSKIYTTPSPEHAESLLKIKSYVDSLQELDATLIQNYIYGLAREYNPEDMKSYFQGLYQVLLGTGNGPRFGTLFKILGKQGINNLIERILNVQIAN